MHAPPLGEKRTYLSLPYMRVLATVLIGHNGKSTAKIFAVGLAEFFCHNVQSSRIWMCAQPDDRRKIRLCLDLSYDHVRVRRILHIVGFELALLVSRYQQENKNS
jgi:hypothetical protein